MIVLMPLTLSSLNLLAHYLCAKGLNAVILIDMTNETVLPVSQQEVDLEFYKLQILALVDSALSLTSQRELVSATEMQDLLLDIRAVVGNPKRPE